MNKQQQKLAEGAENAGEPEDDGVVDADFEEVDEEKK